MSGEMQWAVVMFVGHKFKFCNTGLARQCVRGWAERNTVEPLITDTLINGHLQ
jgi:hypothetical protein